MGWQGYRHGRTPLAAFVRDHVWYVGCDRRETGWILWSVKCLRAATCATLLEIRLLRFGGGFQLCAEHGAGARRRVVTAPALVFSFLLLVYLKSSQIVSAGSPEVKPAEADGSDSAMCRGRAATSGSCHPLFLVHLSCHCHQQARLSYGGPRCVTPPGDLFFLLKKAPLSFKGMTVDSHATNARRAETYLS